MGFSLGQTYFETDIYLKNYAMLVWYQLVWAKTLGSCPFAFQHADTGAVKAYYPDVDVNIVQ